jgi:hypothetical protein
MDYQSEEDFLNSSDSVSARPDKNLVYGVECGPKPKILYCQNQFVTGNNAIGNYALGKIQVGSSVGPSFTEGAILGKLRLAYTVRCSGVRLKRSPVASGTIAGRYVTKNNDIYIKEVDAGFTTVSSPTLEETIGSQALEYKYGTLEDATVRCVTSGKYQIKVPTLLLTEGDVILVDIIWSGFRLFNNIITYPGMSNKLSTQVDVNGPVKPGASPYLTYPNGKIAISYCDFESQGIGINDPDDWSEARGATCTRYSGDTLADITFNINMPVAAFYGYAGPGELTVIILNIVA